MTSWVLICGCSFIKLRQTPKNLWQLCVTAANQSIHMALHPMLCCLLTVKAQGTRALRVHAARKRRTHHASRCAEGMSAAIAGGLQNTNHCPARYGLQRYIWIGMALGIWNIFSGCAAAAAQRSTSLCAAAGRLLSVCMCFCSTAAQQYMELRL